MSAPTEELGRVLRASAADTLERAHPAGPQRRGSAGAAPQVSAALMRAVEAVKRQQKKQGITQEWDLAQRRTETEDPTEFARALGRAVEAAERARKKQVITRAIAKSQRG